MSRARIISTGSYAPDKILTNRDLEKMVETSNEWIIERTGISQRRIAARGQAASDLATEAAKIALHTAGLAAVDLDLVIVATVTGDMAFPSTACFVQKNLGAEGAAAFDLNAACSGFIYGLSAADAFIKSGVYRRVLVIGAETLSKFTDWDDRTTCVLFGDGAGAVILEASKGRSGIISTRLHADGGFWELLHLPAGGSRMPATERTVKDRLHYIKMKGNETFKVAVRNLETVALETLKQHNLDPTRLALLIPHQANMRIIQAVAKRLGITMDKVMINLDRYGNTSAASIPIALDEAVRTGRINKGDYVLLVAFGGGLTWASALIRW
jgi:3-oxoacyl-[acyl-carrier-protein] synthase III